MVYKVNNSKELLKKAKNKAKQLGIKGELYLSDRKDKKLLMITPDNKKVHFGAKKSITYLEGASEEKRKNYKLRHSKIYTKDGVRAIDIKYSPAMLSNSILW